MFLRDLPDYIGEGGVAGKPALTLTELDRRFGEFLREYHARPHGETKVPPQERWQRGGFVPRMAESLEQLRWLEAGHTIWMGEAATDSIGVDTPGDLSRAPLPRHGTR